MKISLFDDDDLKSMGDMLAGAVERAFDLKALEDTIAKGMARGIITALKMAQRDGLLLRAPTVTPKPAPVQPMEPDEVEAPVVGTPPPEPEPPMVPRFLRPPPDNPFPSGKAVEPPPPEKHYAKTGKIYQKLYKTVADRPHGYITTLEAAECLGGQKFSGPISTWLQKGELEACIVANVRPPTKGLPGRLMINKESLIRRHERRRANSRTRSQENAAP